MMSKNTHEVIYFETAFQGGFGHFGSLEDARAAAEAMKDHPVSFDEPEYEGPWSDDKPVAIREDTSRPRSCSWSTLRTEQQCLYIQIPSEWCYVQRVRKTLTGPDGLEYSREDCEYGEWKPYTRNLNVLVSHRRFLVQGEPEVRKLTIPIRSV